MTAPHDSYPAPAGSRPGRHAGSRRLDAHRVRLDGDAQRTGQGVRVREPHGAGAPA
ncbi:hypothetical protein [Burkholderia ubonensis]|uniref:hypothetical protein n=1 Tax=Burkholderia ubonensis TaxID=101571 RepID=UPI000AE7BD0F|nr:hypothetical protein [Burkholderia ubonensis]